MQFPAFQLEPLTDDELFEDLTLGIKPGRKQRIVELSLVFVIVVLSIIMHQMVGFKLLSLHLFFLPIVLAGFYLGRYRAGLLALLAVISATIVTGMTIGTVQPVNSPLVTGLALLLWAAVLGLTAILVGTLSDQRAVKLVELREAHVGMVAVLTRYLQTADPNLNARSKRVARLCAKVATNLKLPQAQIDNIRVAALLQDIENIEVTTRVIRKAIIDVEGEPLDSAPHTFQGSELVESLGNVLRGAFPVLTQAQTGVAPGSAGQNDEAASKAALAARILQTVRSYDARIHGDTARNKLTPQDAIADMRKDPVTGFEPIILEALEHAVREVGTVSAEIDDPSRLPLCV